MADIYDSEQQSKYWNRKYEEGNTGWDIGSVSRPIREYVDQISQKDLRILIPGAGNAHEAEYLWRAGFSWVHVLDIAPSPLANLQNRLPALPPTQLIQDNFFAHEGQYDLIVEQTFFCSFPPNQANRRAYAQQMHRLLIPGGKLVGLWFQFPLRPEQSSPPYGGSREEYLPYFSPLFEIRVFADCYNSIPPRQGSEIFGLMIKQ